MAKNLNRKGQTHDQLQAACFRWACTAYHPLIYRHLIAIPNDMHAGNVVRWKQYEALGVTTGVWDMQLNWVKEMYMDVRLNKPILITCTYWWEFKVGSDTLSAAQAKFKKAMLPLGHIFNIATEEEEFQTQFKSIVEPTLDYVKMIYGANESNIKVIQ